MGQKKFHLSISIIAGLFFFFLSLYWTKTYWPDLNPPICSARNLLAGAEPYQGCATDYGGRPAAQYPMTAILAAIPFAIIPGNGASAAIWGLANGALVYGIMSQRKRWLFLVFLSGPYALAFIFHQISPIIAVAVLLPNTLPLILIKPQTGLPVIFLNLTTKRALACAVFVLATFIIYPTWPVAWWRSASGYDGTVPILSMPIGAILIILVMLSGPNKDGLFVLWTAMMPQRSIYDLVPLMLVSQTKLHAVIVTILSWVPVIALLIGYSERAWMTLLFIYIPVLAGIYLRRKFVE